jgi:hypothetical protein
MLDCEPSGLKTLCESFWFHTGLLAYWCGSGCFWPCYLFYCFELQVCPMTQMRLLSRMHSLSTVMLSKVLIYVFWMCLVVDMWFLLIRGWPVKLMIVWQWKLYATQWRGNPKDTGSSSSLQKLKLLQHCRRWVVRWTVLHTSVVKVLQDNMQRPVQLFFIMLTLVSYMLIV